MVGSSSEESRSFRECSSGQGMAAQSLGVVLLVGNVEYLIIFIREDGSACF